MYAAAGAQRQGPLRRPSFSVTGIARTLIEDRRLDAEHLVQLRAGGRVLQVDLLVREDDTARRRRRRARASWKPDRISFFLPGIGVDVAHREDARHVGLELLGVRPSSCLRSMSRPHSAIGPSLGDRPKNTSSMSSGTTRVTPSAPVTLTPVSWPSFSSIAGDLADDELHLVRVAQLLHLGHRCRRGA